VTTLHFADAESDGGKCGSANDQPGSTNGKPGSANDMPGSTSNHCKAVWVNDIFFGNVAGVPGNHCYYLSFNDF